MTARPELWGAHCNDCSWSASGLPHALARSHARIHEEESAGTYPSRYIGAPGPHSTELLREVAFMRAYEEDDYQW
jgi:hypothetical protein